MTDWKPQMYLQAMDRCHQIGQTRPVHVYRLATSHSIEVQLDDQSPPPDSKFFDAEIKMDMGPYYFPLFGTQNALQKEKDHVEGFAPEKKSYREQLQNPCQFFGILHAAPYFA